MKHKVAVAAGSVRTRDTLLSRPEKHDPGWTNLKQVCLQEAPLSALVNISEPSQTYFLYVGGCQNYGPFLGP